MSFLKYSFQTAGVRVALSGLGLVGGIINARWLGPEGVGMVALLVMMPGVAYRFGNLGFGSALAFFIAKQRLAAGRAVRLAWVIGLSTAGVMCAALLVFWRHRISPWHDIPDGLFYLALPTVPLFFMANYLRRILAGQLRITPVNASAIIDSGVFIPLLVVYVVVLDLGVMGSLYAFLISQYAVVLFLAVQFLRRGEALQGPEASPIADEVRSAELWRYGRWSYLLILMNSFLADLPVYFLKYFSSNQIVGLFSVGRNLSRRPYLVVEPFARMLFPFTAASEARDAARRTSTLCRTALPVMLLVVLVLMVIADPLITFLYGDTFRPAVKVLYALGPAVVVYPVSQFLGIHIAGVGDPKMVCLTAVAGIAATVAMCCMLLPGWGAVGAAITVSGVYILVGALRLAVYVRRTDARVPEVLIVQRSDIQLYRNVYAKLAGRMSRIRGA